MKKHYKKIYVFIGDPFNKKYIEQALIGIPYEYRYNNIRNCAMYKLKHTLFYGSKFVHNLRSILHENGVKMLYNRTGSNGRCLVFQDKALREFIKTDESVDLDTVL